jgi:integrase
MALTAAFVSKTQKTGRHFDGGGLGLHLLVKPSGSRSWVQRVKIHGKRRDLGLGSPPVVTLAEARETALENMRIVKRGGDPLAERRKANRILTFEEAARRVVVELTPTWKDQRKEATAFISSLERHVFPRIGQMQINKIGSADVRAVMLAAREKVPFVAAKLSYRISAVFKWAVAEQMRDDNPSGALNLPKMRSTGGHFSSLPYPEVAHCIDTVRGSGARSATKLALEFLILTAARSGEVRAATWDEIKGDVWRVPEERTKTGREHAVPLSPRALTILEEAKQLGGELIFPSPRGMVLSDMTLSKLVRELGFDATVHGFRSSFRTWAQEQTNAPREVAEAALAHISGDKVERAYARSDFFDKRRKLMEQWASYLDVKRGEVVRLA